MLVLSRTRDESIEIGVEITVTVLEVKGKRVKLGIEAPEEFRITRRPLDDDGGKTNRTA